MLKCFIFICFSYVWGRAGFQAMHKSAVCGEHVESVESSSTAVGIGIKQKLEPLRTKRAVTLK